MTYTLTVNNYGVRGKGLAVEDVSIALTVPTGVNVTSASGAEVRRDTQTGAQTATWKVLRISPEDTQTYAITVSGQVTQDLRGVVRWARPTERDASTSGEANIAPPPRSSQR